MTAPENPMAFPCTTRKNTSSDPFATPRETSHPGMTLRDYFAGQALLRMDESADFPQGVAEWAYQVADAMLAARFAQGDA